MFKISCNLIEYQGAVEKLASNSRLNPTPSPGLERIKITWVSGISVVLRIPVKKAEGIFLTNGKYSPMDT